MRKLLTLLFAFLPFFLQFDTSWLALGQTAYPEAFPISVGTTWVYRGNVKWTKPGTDNLSAREITWEMKVIETRTLGKARMARIKGHPLDLAWYEEGKPPGNYLLLTMENRRIYLLPEAFMKECWLESTFERIKANEAKWVDFLFLDLPLTRGKLFGNPEMLKRNDTFYAWLVRDVRPANLSTVSGVQRAASVEEYELILRTLSDHQIISFVPGVGIIRYQHSHHGTVSEADMRLVEFLPASPAARKLFDAFADSAH